MINIQKIERERKRLKISKVEMSRQMNMSRQAYYDLLDNGSTTLKTLEKIAVILDYNVKDLLTD
jgi:transcriptional regulator with XRE-family HTH domain